MTLLKQLWSMTTFIPVIIHQEILILLQKCKCKRLNIYISRKIVIESGIVLENNRGIGPFLELGVHILELGVHILELGVHILELGVHILEIGVHILELGLHILELGLKSITCKQRFFKFHSLKQLCTILGPMRNWKMHKRPS